MHFPASKLTLALREALTGNSRTWFLAALSPAVELVEESAATLGFMDHVRRLRTSVRPSTRSWTDLITALQDEASKLAKNLTYQEVQLPTGIGESDPLHRELSSHERQRLLEELFTHKQLDTDAGVRLAREREVALESMGLLSVDTEEAFSHEQVTPYLLNMSDDPQLAGCLLYFLRCSASTSIGGSPECTIFVNGLGVLPKLCTIVNHDNVRVSLQRPDESHRHVLLNGQVLSSSSELQLCHHDRIYLGQALVLRLYVPLQADVETIDESQEHTGTLPPPPNHELVLCNYPRECLPVLPERSHNFVDLQGYMKHSESFSELQLYMEDLYDKLDTDRGHAFFRALQEACHLIDEANAITRKVRPEERFHFEVEFVWDIYRDVEDILMIRAMHCAAEGRGDTVLHYWTYAKFKERLDIMREVYFEFYHSGAWPQKGDVLEDPWIEPSNSELQQRLLNSMLSERRRAIAAQDRPMPSSIYGGGSIPSSSRSGSAVAKPMGVTEVPRTPPVSAATPGATMWSAEGAQVSTSRMRSVPRSSALGGKDKPAGAATAAAVAANAGVQSAREVSARARQLPRAPRPAHATHAATSSTGGAGPDACAGDASDPCGLFRGRAVEWSSSTTSASTHLTAAPSAHAHHAAESERLKELVISLQQQLMAVKEKN